jgi:hypothetical protein
MVPLVVAIVAAHVAIPFVFSHMAISTAIATGVLVLVVLKHLGLATAFTPSLRARLRGRR